MQLPKKDPLRGISLQAILETLVSEMGWVELSQYIPIKCFTVDPTIKSSITFLRKTPVERVKVEKLFLRTHRARMKKL